MRNLRDLTYEDLVNEVKALGEKPYRALQIYSWVYRAGVTSVDAMTDISKASREKLKVLFGVGALEVAGVKESADGTRKFLSRLDCGLTVESVLIPDEDRLTLCVSSQAGCALNCAFCVTGAGGFSRNLTLSELAGQVFSARSLLRENERITNIVLMGMGEPLLNYENVIKFINILVDARAFGLSHNKITLSTAGIIPGIKRLGRDANINLAVSINATDDATRSSIMPVNAKYPLKDLIQALYEYPLGHKRFLTIEYVLIKGLNDGDARAKELARLLRGIRCKINVIPFNGFPGARFEAPKPDDTARFADILRKAGYDVFIRFSKGSDIGAACGQLSGMLGGGRPTKVLTAAPF